MAVLCWWMGFPTPPYVSERKSNAIQIPDNPLHFHHSQHHLPSCTQRSCTKAWSLSNSNSNSYKPKWHRSKCCRQKCTRMRCAQVKIVSGKSFKRCYRPRPLIDTKVPLIRKKQEEKIGARTLKKHGGIKIHTLVMSSHGRQIAQF